MNKSVVETDEKASGVQPENRTPGQIIVEIDLGGRYRGRFQAWNHEGNELTDAEEKELRRLFSRAPALLRSNGELLEACKFMFGEIESGNLLRDITKDGEPDWSMRMMKFTMELGKVQAAIANAEKAGAQ